MHVLTLNRAKWKKFKTDHNLSKSSFFAKADVGPTIEDFEKAALKFAKSVSEKDLMTLFSKCQKLQAAFKKFIALKEAKAELTPEAKKQIQAWDGELDGIATDLAKLVKDAPEMLKRGDVKQLEDNFETMFPWAK
jgi:hypothetical protein